MAVSNLFNALAQSSTLRDALSQQTAGPVLQDPPVPGILNGKTPGATLRGNPGPVLSGGDAAMRGMTPNTPDATLNPTPAPASEPWASALFPSTQQPNTLGPYNPAQHDPNQGIPPALSALFGASGFERPEPSLRDKAADLYSQAQNIENAPAPHLAFRTADLLAALPALFMGQGAPAYLAGLLGGKENYAQNETAYQQAAVDRQRQALIEQAQGLMQAANTQDLIQGRSDLGRHKDETELAKQDKKNQGAIELAEYRYKGKELDNKTRASLANLVSQDKELSAAHSLLPKLSGPARAAAIKIWRDKFPVLGDFDDDALDAMAQDTASETQKRADAAAKQAEAKKFDAQVGYLGAQADSVRALIGPRRDAFLAKVNLTRQQVRESAAKAGLDEAQTNLIGERARLYEPNMRRKWADNAARLVAAENGKALDKDPQKSNRLALQSAQTLGNLARAQINRITDNGKKDPPEPLLPDGTENPDYTTYQQAVHDQQVSSAMARKLAQSRPIASPETMGQPKYQPAVGDPSGLNRFMSVPTAGAKMFGQTIRPGEEAMFSQVQQAMQDPRIAASSQARAAVVNRLIQDLQARRRR